MPTEHTTPPHSQLEEPCFLHPYMPLLSACGADAETARWAELVLKKAAFYHGNLDSTLRQSVPEELRERVADALAGAVLWLRMPAAYQPGAPYTKDAPFLAREALREACKVGDISIKKLQGLYPAAILQFRAVTVAALLDRDLAAVLEASRQGKDPFDLAVEGLREMGIPELTEAVLRVMNTPLSTPMDRKTVLNFAQGTAKEPHPKVLTEDGEPVDAFVLEMMRGMAMAGHERGRLGGAVVLAVSEYVRGASREEAAHLAAEKTKVNENSILSILWPKSPEELPLLTSS